MTADLIARLETAQEGSRELSDEVLEALGWTETTERTGWGEYIWSAPRGGPQRTLDPSRNLQDAVDLVPEWWLVHTLGQDDNGTWWCALTSQYASSYDRRVQCEKHPPTPALALCAAILRTQGDDNGR